MATPGCANRGRRRIVRASRVVLDLLPNQLLHRCTWRAFASPLNAYSLGSTTVPTKAAGACVRPTNRDVRDWMYHLVFPDEPPLTKEQCRDSQASIISYWMHALRKQKQAGGPHWPHVPIVFSTPYAK